jgi:hypothetical protein
VHGSDYNHVGAPQEQLRLKKRAERFKSESGSAPGATKTGAAAEFEAKKKVGTMCAGGSVLLLRRARKGMRSRGSR